MALTAERQSARKSKTNNSRLGSLASNPSVTVPILELWAKWVNAIIAVIVTRRQMKCAESYDTSLSLCPSVSWIHLFVCKLPICTKTAKLSLKTKLSHLWISSTIIVIIVKFYTVTFIG